MPQRTVAYLDLLGFKSYTRIDAAAAAQLLLDYHQIINTKLEDMAHFPANAYGDPSLRTLAQAGELGSFQTLLPFSDSVFVISDQPDLLLKQLSRFLIDSFELTSNAFSHLEQPDDPSVVTIKTLSLQGVVSQIRSRWFPLLFRGGISYGDVMTPRVTAIIDAVPNSVINIAGTAIVNAVGLEKTGKGPRLFCTAEFRSQLGEESQQFLAAVPKSDRFELLWPALLYHDWNSPHVEINDFSKLFLPAVNLWRAFRHDADVEPHYLQFLKLIVRATLETFGRHGFLNLALDHVKGRISAYGAEELSDSLLP